MMRRQLSGQGNHGVQLDGSKLRATLERWKWTASSLGVLQTQDGELNLAMVGKSTVHLAAKRAWVRWMASNDPRGADRASACLLQDTEPFLEQHRRLHLCGGGATNTTTTTNTTPTTTTQVPRHVVLGSGYDGCTIDTQMDLLSVRADIVCICQSAWLQDSDPSRKKHPVLCPTRRHLTWHCPCRSRVVLPPPRCGLEEALCVPLVSRRPMAREIALRADALLVSFVEGWCIHPQFQAWCAATDGGADGQGAERVAGVGIAFAHDLGYNAAVRGIDTTPGFAELWAVYQLLEAVAEVAESCLDWRFRPVYVAIDNQNVQRLLQQTLDGRRVPSGHHFALWRRMGQIASVINVRTLWIPSHGKKKGKWSPPEWCHDEGYWRALNKRADEDASYAVAREVQRIAPWREELEAAASWVSTALRVQEAGLTELRVRYPQYS